MAIEDFMNREQINFMLSGKIEGRIRISGFARNGRFVEETICPKDDKVQHVMDEILGYLISANVSKFIVEFL